MNEIGGHDYKTSAKSLTCTYMAQVYLSIIMYRETSNISRTLVGSNIVDHKM